MKPIPLKTAGFTLIELMVTLAIIAILAAVATPSMLTFKRNAELTSVVNSFVSALNATRSEAMKRNTNAAVAPSTAGGWVGGWNVFVDTNRDGIFNGTDILVMNQPALPSYLSFVGNGTFALGAGSYFMYDASGFPTTVGSGAVANATVEIKRTDAGSSFDQYRRVKISTTGRISVCTPKVNLDPMCPP